MRRAMMQSNLKGYNLLRLYRGQYRDLPLESRSSSVGLGSVDWLLIIPLQRGQQTGYRLARSALIVF